MLPLVTPKTSAPKVVVAQSDYESVLQAIDNVMKDEYTLLSKENEINNEVENESMVSGLNDGKGDNSIQPTTTTTQENNNDDDVSMEENQDDSGTSENNSDETQNDNEDQSQQQKMQRVKDAFLEQVHMSLKERLNQIVDPLSDEEFHKRSRGHIVQQQIEEEDEQEQFLIAQEEAERAAQEETRRQQEQMHCVDCNVDYDEHELLDQDAVKRAKELREQVRATAADMKQRQNAILNRAIQLAQREVRLVTNDILLEESQASKENKILDNGDAIKRHDARRLMLQQMKVSLQTLLTSVSKTVEGELPENLVDLQDTIGTIEKSLIKKRQPESLSQTEKAILSRTNEGIDYNGTSKKDSEGPSMIVEEESGLNDMTNPYVFLADFLGRY